MKTPNWHGYPCPYCNAERGQGCTSPATGRALTTSHLSREPQARPRSTSPEDATLQALTNAIVLGNGF
jgi:hypothetical protein